MGHTDDHKVWKKKRLCPVARGQESPPHTIFQAHGHRVLVLWMPHDAPNTFFVGEIHALDTVPRTEVPHTDDKVIAAGHHQLRTWVRGSGLGTEETRTTEKIHTHMMSSHQYLSMIQPVEWPQKVGTGGNTHNTQWVKVVSNPVRTLSRE